MDSFSTPSISVFSVRDLVSTSDAGAGVVVSLMVVWWLYDVFSEKCIASGTFCLHIIFFELKICIAFGCVWGFSKIGIASSACFFHYPFLHWKFA